MKKLKMQTPDLKAVDFDLLEQTLSKNLIEGDNFEMLKMLQKSYLGKVKMIYIDPPYNELLYLKK